MRQMSPFATTSMSLLTASLSTRSGFGPVLAKIRKGELSGAYESRGSADGTVRLGAFHKLSDYPVIVLAAVEKAASLGAVSKRGLFCDVRRLARRSAIRVPPGFAARRVMVHPV